ncbi:hypothetical protein ACFYUL_13515 [Streptomyces sp. NPDC004311]|uniref:hypothetical protein n=1 Tax=Streptomyces sp. NPDC004311 TaxID=3364698 RepID=UPI0036A3F68B
MKRTSHEREPDPGDSHQPTDRTPQHRTAAQTWEPDPGSLGYTATIPGSWIVYALWPPITVALAVFVVRRRDV